MGPFERDRLVRYAQTASVRWVYGSPTVQTERYHVARSQRHAQDLRQLSLIGNRDYDWLTSFFERHPDEGGVVLVHALGHVLVRVDGGVATVVDPPGVDPVTPLGGRRATEGAVSHGIDVCACGMVLVSCRCVGPHVRRVVTQWCHACRPVAASSPRPVIDVRLVQTREGSWRASIEGRLVVAGARDTAEALAVVAADLANRQRKTTERT